MAPVRDLSTTPEESQCAKREKGNIFSFIVLLTLEGPAVRAWQSFLRLGRGCFNWVLPGTEAFVGSSSGPAAAVDKASASVSPQVCEAASTYALLAQLKIFV